MDNKHESKPADVRIVLVGKTGAGKSSAGNRIVGVNAGSRFPVGSGFGSTTQECKKLTTTLDAGPLAGKTLAVVDTPGLCHSKIERKQLIEELVHSVTLVKPGPDVFLLVIDPSGFNTDDEKSLNTFKKLFKKAESHTIVLFTHCHGNQVTEAFLKDKCSRSACDFIMSMEHQAFDCKAENQQVSELLEKIHRLVSNNKGKLYTSDWSEKLFEELNRSESTLVSRSELQSWLTKCCRDRMNLCPPLKKFVEFVQEVTYELMPDSAKQ